MKVPHTAPGSVNGAREGRFASTLGRDSSDGCAIALLGLPFDGGIALNHGRVGAAQGPRAFREALARYGTTFDLARGGPIGVGVFDAGDVVPVEMGECGGDAIAALHATHDRVTEAVGSLHDAGLTPVCIGGGHDLTFAGVRGGARHGDGTAWGGINVDAHLDVREEVGSGMPYRRLIDDGLVEPRAFVELGIGRFACDRAHVEWLEGRGGRIIETGAVLGDDAASRVDEAFDTALSRSDGFVSIDMDAIDGSQAPGVSAVNPMGLSVGLVLSIAERAGRSARVRHFDIMELSPPHDVDGRTARIAALLFLGFVAGFAERAR